MKPRIFVLSALIFLSHITIAQFITSSPGKFDPSTLQNLAEMGQRQKAIDAQNRLAEEERTKEAAAICSNQIYDWYYSLDSHPNTISDGWKRAMITDKVSFCDEKYVYVQSNKITKFVLNDKDTQEKNVYMSTSIEKGKCMMRLKFSDGTYSNFIDVIFVV